MTIQPSVVIWTILCFTALYFILKYLLFRPILSLMDQRQKKIDDAKASREAAARQQEEARLRLLAEREKTLRRTHEERAAEAEKTRMEGKKLLEDKKKERIAYVDAHRQKTEADFGEDMKQAEAPADRAATLFLTHLFNS